MVSAILKQHFAETTTSAQCGRPFPKIMANVGSQHEGEWISKSGAMGCNSQNQTSVRIRDSRQGSSAAWDCSQVGR